MIGFLAYSRDVIVGFLDVFRGFLAMIFLVELDAFGWILKGL